MRSKEQIEAHGEEQKAPSEQGKKQRVIGNPSKIKPFMWKPGQSGNPGGRPKRDFASEIAQAVFEKNPELVYKAMTRLLEKGSAFGFQVLSDRAYGKLTDKLDVEVDASALLVQKLMEGRKRLQAKRK